MNTIFFHGIGLIWIGIIIILYDVPLLLGLGERASLHSFIHSAA